VSFKKSIKESFQYACTPPAGSGKKPDPTQISDRNNREVIIRTYTGSQEWATSQFQSDSVEMTARGYYPTSQSWAPGSYGCGSFICALLLCFIVVGVLVFIYMLLVKPDGTLTVTYEYRSPNIVTKLEPVVEKTCPKCAEDVKDAAKICRFCGHVFTVLESEE
jgi:hypothetical protein